MAFETTRYWFVRQDDCDEARRRSKESHGPATSPEDWRVRCQHYDLSVKFPGEEVGPSKTGTCSRCGEEFEEVFLQPCPWCFKAFCRNCRFAGGVVGYCSRACAEAMFYGGDTEEEAEEE